MSPPDGRPATDRASTHRGTDARGAFSLRTAADLVRAYREGRTTPADVAERALAAAGALDAREPPMRTFLALHAGDVRAQAAASTARWRAGASLGPLDGVPVAIKDEYDVEGYGTTHGSAFMGKLPATRDTLAVARLRAAGAVLFGKTNMHEFGLGPSGSNPHHGAARNPHDPARDTGGSSSGSAAAVASGVVPIAIGTDSGGSVRVPGSLCGVASIKPTFGRVPTDGASLRAWSIEHFGPLGSSVADVASALAVLAGERATPLPPAFSDREGALRIGVCDAWWQGADASVATIVRAALERLVAAGARLVPVALPHLDLVMPVMTATFTVEAAASLEAEIAAGRPMSDSARLSFDLARGLPAVAFVKAQRARALIARDFERALDAVDVLVTPTTGTTAPRYVPGQLRGAGVIDEAVINPLVHFTAALNLTGHPAAQVPCGIDGDGMPVGLQVIAARGDDLLALAVAAEVERTAARARPRVWADLLA